MAEIRTRSQNSPDVRWLLGIIVVVASGVAGGVWMAQITNSNSGVVFSGVIAGIFLGIALTCTGWIASSQPRSRPDSQQ